MRPASSRTSNVAGLVLGDILLVLAAMALVAALAYPRVGALLFDRRLEAVVADVETVKNATLRHHDELNRWPPPAAVGVVPDGLDDYLPAGYSFAKGDYSLLLERWERVESTEMTAAPEIVDLNQIPDSVVVTPAVVSDFASLSVRSSQEPLLASLLQRFGPARSFVRDSTWTLILAPPN